MNVQRDYWMQLFSNLLNACPVDTRNMVTHIQMFETSDNFIIEIAAPYATNPRIQATTDARGFTDYAMYVNEVSRPYRDHRGWVEREMKRTQDIMNGRNQYL